MLVIPTHQIWDLLLSCIKLRSVIHKSIEIKYINKYVHFLAVLTGSSLSCKVWTFKLISSTVRVQHKVKFFTVIWQNIKQNLCTFFIMKLNFTSRTQSHQYTLYSVYFSRLAVLTHHVEGSLLLVGSVHLFIIRCTGGNSWFRPQSLHDNKTN